jgi:C4-dicarboxylate-specific signal transduction histidine kinase
VQIINDALQVLDQHGTRTLIVASEHKDGIAVVHVSDTDLAGCNVEYVEYKEQTAESQETLSGLGLNACQAILRQHRGKLLWWQDRNAGTSIRIELPVIALPEKAGVPVMWQPQPFA